MLRLLAAALVAALCIPGCGASSADFASDQDRHAASGSVPRYAGQYPIRVVCTTGMVADIAFHVGGDHVAVTALMGEGVDPHLYKASPADVNQLNRADIVLYSGLHLEGKLAELLERMGRRKPTVPLAERISSEKLMTDEHGVRDPHIWFDVALWSDAVLAAAEALSQFDPNNAAAYEANAQAYRKRMAALDSYARDQFATITKEQRVLVTAHDAFRYLGRAYEVDVRGIQGISTDSEAGVREVKALVDFLTSRKIKAVFVETSVSDQNIRSLLEGCAARGHQIVIGGSLYSDAMGQAGTPQGTYEGMVRHNVDTIVNALRPEGKIDD